MELFETVGKYHQFFVKELSSIYPVQEAESISKLLLAFILKKEWFEITQQLNEKLPPAFHGSIEEAYKRLMQHEPIQYILGKAHFYGRDFEVSPAVLIPRGETEELMVCVRDLIATMNQVSPRPWKILDIGTGTGCIPISLGAELALLEINTELFAVDISEKALAIAQKNAQLYKVNIAYSRLDILQASCTYFHNLDFIISNPPYIPEKEHKSMSLHVVEYEPSSALFVPNNDPLIFYRKIVSLSKDWLKPNGFLCFEIHEDYGQDVLDLFDQFFWTKAIIKKDLHGKDRIVMAKRKS